MYGDPQWVVGHSGSAVQFAGADALTSVNPGFNDNTGSLECWVYFSGTSGNDSGTILRLDGTSPYWSYHIIDRINGNEVRYRFYNDNTKIGYSVTSGQLSAGWHYILATHSTTTGTIELFIDGVSQGTAAYYATTCAGAALHGRLCVPRRGFQWAVGHRQRGSRLLVGPQLRRATAHPGADRGQHHHLPAPLQRRGLVAERYFRLLHQRCLERLHLQLRQSGRGGASCDAGPRE